MITSYAFGKMVVAGRTYTSDLMIFPDGRIRDNWYRESGHLLVPVDIEDLRAAGPDLIIIGTGANGRMALADRLADSLAAEGIDILAMETAKAVARYNDMISRKEATALAACFHLTC